MAKKDNGLLIPFVRPVRVGNFKLWRSRYNVKTAEGKMDIECINISNVGGEWSVRIPSTASLFSVIANGYATVDEKLRENFLGMIFANIWNVSTSGSTAVHDAFFFLMEMMVFPYLLLSEKEMQSRMEKMLKSSGMDKERRKAHIREMTEYRQKLYEQIEKKRDEVITGYEQQIAERNAMAAETDAEMRQDEIAEQAMDILTEEN